MAQALTLKPSRGEYSLKSACFRRFRRCLHSRCRSLRGCPVKGRTNFCLMRHGFGEAAQPDPTHRHVDEGFIRFRKSLVIDDQSAVGQKPSEASLDNPSPRENMKPFRQFRHVVAVEAITSAEIAPPVLDDFNGPAELTFGPCPQALVMGVGPHEHDPREQEV